MFQNVRTYGVRVSGWLYILGTLVLLVGGTRSSSTSMVVASICFLAGSGAYAFVGIYWLGCLLRLFGQFAFFAAIPWGAMAIVSSGLSILAMAVGSLEPYIGDRRKLVFRLSVLSRAPLLSVAWNDPWLLASILVLIAGDACLGISKPNEKPP